MVIDFYRLREHPFGVTPDARYIYLSSTHREALTSLLYGVDSGCGFVALIAPPGAGKTTLLFQLLNQLREKALTVFLFQTVSTPVDLLRTLLNGLGVTEPEGTLVELQWKLMEILLQQAKLGKRVVVVIDEAQNLDESVLELIRMLSNFETQREKLIQIIFSGQPQLADKIGAPGLEQLRQRVSIFACLTTFSREDTQLYIEHRLRVAGYAFDVPFFTRDALTLIAEASQGIPRNINNLCFNSMALGCALQQKPIDSAIVREVIADLDLGRWKKASSGMGRDRKEEPAVPAFVSSEGSPSGWGLRLAMGLAALFVICGVLFAGGWWPAHRARGAVPTAVSVGSREGAVAAAPAVAPVVSRRVAAVASVSVTPGKTLMGICVEAFGTCSAELLQQIRELNPRLNNLDHIETGQILRMPAASDGQGGRAGVAAGEQP